MFLAAPFSLQCPCPGLRRPRIYLHKNDIDVTFKTEYSYTDKALEGFRDIGKIIIGIWNNLVKLKSNIRDIEIQNFLILGVSW